MNKLTSLEGAPQKVGRSFYCDRNKLTSLIGAPQEVKGYFDCSKNKLTSLEGAPQEVGEDFDCSCNKLTSFIGGPQEVKDRLFCHNNKLTSLEGAPKKCGYVDGFRGNLVDKEILISYVPNVENSTWIKKCFQKKLHQIETLPGFLTATSSSIFGWRNKKGLRKAQTFSKAIYKLFLGWILPTT